jgi:hypothetical protein
MSIESLTDSITLVAACTEEERHTLQAGPKAVDDLARNLYRCWIRQSSCKTTVEMVSEDYKTVSFNDIVAALKDNIRFVDEAIPVDGLQSEEKERSLIETHPQYRPGAADACSHGWDRILFTKYDARLRF